MKEHDIESGNVPETKEQGFLASISNAAVHVGAVLLQITAVALVINALYRYTIGGGFMILSEGSRFVLLVVVFLGLAGTHLSGGHVKVEILMSALPHRIRSVLEGYLVPVVSIVFLALIIWSGWVATMQMYAHGTTTPTRPAILLWPLAAVVPLGAGLLVLVLLGQLLRRLTGSRP